MFQKITTFLIILFCPVILISQYKYGTCHDALEICSKGTLVFNFETLSTAAPIQLLPCLEAEYKNMVWIKWKIKEAGYLTFSILPSGHFREDIDFAVYKSFPNEKQLELQLIRCMTSGANGMPDGTINPNSLRCLGKMGLSVAEPKEQIHESPGCGSSDNNFLAALDCKKGEEYYLAIAQFDSPKTAYTLSLCGTAKLPCDTVFCEEYTNQRSKLPEKKIISFSENNKGKHLPLYIEGYDRQTVKITIKNELGEFMDIQHLEILNDQNYFDLPVNHLPKGEYILSIELKKQKVEGRFIKY